MIDANIYANPGGPDQLFSLGTSLTVIPIDLTNRVILDEDHIDRIREGRTP